MIDRRRFLRTVSVSLLAAPLGAQAQQAEKVPLIGYLSSRSPGDSAHIIAAFRQGLKDGGFVEGQKHPRQCGQPVVPATIPMVFAMGGDPVRLGIVPNLARPGGHITGVSFLVNGSAAKQLQLLRDLVPRAGILGFLVNPTDPNFTPDTKDAQAAADALGHKLAVVSRGHGRRF